MCSSVLNKKKRCKCEHKKSDFSNDLIQPDLNPDFSAYYSGCFFWHSVQNASRENYINEICEFLNEKQHEWRLGEERRWVYTKDGQNPDLPDD